MAKSNPADQNAGGRVGLMTVLLGHTLILGAYLNLRVARDHSARASHALHQVLGDDAGGDVVDWMHQADASRAELRELNDLNYARFDARLDGRLSAAEARLDARFAEFRREMSAELGTFNTEVRSELAAMRLEIHGAVTGFDAKMERRFNDLLKWSFVFWCGAVGAIAALAKVLR